MASYRQTAEGTLTLKPIVHEIRIQNQVIFLDPPIEYARATWVKQLHDWLGMVSLWMILLYVDECSQVLFVGYVIFKALDMKLGCRCKVVHQWQRQLIPL